MERFFKKIIAFTLLLLAAPIIVFAEQPYITYSDIKCNGKDIINAAIQYTTGSTEGILIDYQMEGEANSKYSFVIIGHEIVDDDAEYTLTLTSDFKNFKKTYTGAELRAGVTISGEDGDSTMVSKIVDKYNRTLANKYTRPGTSEYFYFKESRFVFNRNFDTTGMDAIYNSMLTNGKIKINTVDPTDDFDFAETAITAALSKYETERYRIYGSCNTKNDCFVNISDKIDYSKYKEYKVEYEFVKPNMLIKNRIDNYAKSFKYEEMHPEKYLFTMEDLETINYKYTSPNFGDIDAINAIINYSSEYQNKIGYTNIGTKLDARAGWDDKFSSGCFGYLNLIYDGIVYSYVKIAGVKQNNVLYVPDETKDTTEAYINAALERIKKYIPKAEVKIEYAGQIDKTEEYGALDLEEIVDVSKTLDEYYKVTIGEKEYYYFIAKDSSKMRKPMMNTVDVDTDISIKTEASEVPLDSKINTIVIDAKSDEYKEFLKQVNVSNGLVVDLKLFSESINKNISKLDSGIFKVYVPLTDELKTLDLTAYYIKDDGEIEKHKVTIEDNYLVFETNHFSTYIIGGNKIENPATLDNIGKIIVVNSLSFITLIGVLFYKKKIKITN